MPEEPDDSIWNRNKKSNLTADNQLRISVNHGTKETLVAMATIDMTDLAILVSIIPVFQMFTCAVKPLFYDHPQNHIGVIVKDWWSSTRDLTIL